MSGSSPGTTFYLLREIYSKYDMQKSVYVQFLIIQLPLFLEHTTDFIYMMSFSQYLHIIEQMNREHNFIK